MANLENNNQNNDTPPDPSGKKKPSSSAVDQINEKITETAQDLKEGVKTVAHEAKKAVENPVQTVGNLAEQATKDVTSVKWWAKLLLIIFWSALGIVVSVLIVVNLPATKKWAANQALQVLNQDFKAEMYTDDVQVNYFGDVIVNGLRIKDHKGLEFIKIKQFRANSNWLALVRNALSANNNSLSFNALTLTNADIKVITYEGDSISNFIRYIDNFDSGKERDPGTPPFQLDSRVHLINSRVSIVNKNSEGEEGNWLQAENLNLKAPKIKVNGGDVFAQINNLNFTTTRWGKKHYVDTFSTEAALTDDFLLLKDLTINTDHSLLQGDLKFNLNNGSWSNFTERVRWEMELKRGSQISGYDISYFVTDWDNYKPVNISGRMAGPLNNFHLHDFVLGNKQVSINTSTMKLANLMEGDFLIETNHLSTDFTYRDLKAMLPSFISEPMKDFADDFGRLRYTGAARITPKQIFVPRGNLITGIGRAFVRNFYLTDYSNDIPKYRGYAEVTDLNTFAITKSKEVGLISGNFQLDGQSFDVNTMRIRTTSRISKIEILNKEINNVYLNGLLNEKVYTGVINVDDQQARANVEGRIDFRTSRIRADVAANIRHLNLTYFTGGKGTQNISGNLKGNLSMTDLNDMTLDANLNGVSFSTGKERFDIPTADVKAFFENGNRVVSVNAPGAVNGKITGKYNLADLQEMITNGLNKILVGPPPRKMFRNQQFNIEFEVRQNIVNYFMPELRISNGAFVIGSYDGNENNLVLNLDATEIKYYFKGTQEINEAEPVLVSANPPAVEVIKDSILVNNLAVRINTANLEEQIFAKIDRGVYGENIFREVTITGNKENNQQLNIGVSLQHGDEEDEVKGALQHYAVNFNQTTNSAGDYIVRFDPTALTLNDVTWHIDTSPALNHSVIYRKATGDIELENVRIYSQDSELFVKNALFKSGSDFVADGEVKNFQVAKLLEMQEDGNSLDIQGVANGIFNIRMNGGNLEPLVNLRVQDISMGGEDMGIITVVAKSSDIPNVFDVDAKVVSAGIIGNNNLDVSGTIDNNTPSPTLNIHANMDDFDLRFANQFVKGIFSNLRGKANGSLAITGTLKEVDYSGDISLKDFGLKLDFTGVDYSFDDTMVHLTRGAAVLNNIGVRDGRANSSGTISGAIYFETLASMAVELIMRADNLLMLNSTQEDYDLFWGRIYGEGDLYVSGPVNSLSIQTPNMRALNNSVFTFNSNSTSNVEEFKMLRFLKEDDKGSIITESVERSGANMNINFRLTVDKGTTVNVLVGDDIGNISVRGASEDLRFHMSRNGNIEMNGGYIVDTGTFTSKAVLNRTFQIEKGSSILWDGDAMTPSLDITANYVRTVSNAGDYLGVGYLQPIQVLLQTKITQTLNNPKISLGVSAMDVSSQIKETLASRMNEEDERVIQFGSVLLMNRFNTSATGFNVANIAEDTGYNILFKQLGSVLNTISSEFQIDLNYIKGDEASQTRDRANAGVSFALSPRVSVKTGLGIPLSRGSEGTNTDYLSGEGTIEYDASKKNDGTLVLRGYSKPMNIGMGTQMGTNSAANQAYGVGVVWSKSFNRIFGSKKNDKNHVPKLASDTITSEKKDSLQ
ncbi:translocation/assembly module TamB [Chryseobacterium lacus]|uniref:Translocation/assembly module TamB n=1 Tax=Chryseobacterium lacus TaxID=2058346 RepID=A0A368N3Q8_9FLAO|nr:translocation/assembly module TamB [Chryseobacterium lacus]RCU44171.1 translocation/assembly module TamB [Chryseobacterium lacus]RST28924.1 translocation/assembly module TamB [Chryseobacterium lacus]